MLRSVQCRLGIEPSTTLSRECVLNTLGIDHVYVCTVAQRGHGRADAQATLDTALVLRFDHHSENQSVCLVQWGAMYLCSLVPVMM